MSLPLLIIFAVVLPLILFAGIYFFSRGTIWLALRPRILGAEMMVFGAIYVGLGVWTARDGLGWMSTLLIVGAVAGFISGVYTWRRGEPQSLE
ncbi:MAG: hypothetical protein ABR524_10575 [Thermoanaerobaculia bacterium]